MPAQDQQLRCQQTSTLDALVVEAVLALSRRERNHVFTREIANEVNRLQELRGDRCKPSPETVGRRLAKFGLRSHRLSKDVNGLTFDQPTRTVIRQLAAVYVMEDTLTEANNLHRTQVTETT